MASNEAIALVYAKVLELDAQLRERDATIAAMREERRRWPWETTGSGSGSILREHTTALISLERAVARGDATAAGALPAAMYRHVIELEGQLEEAAKQADELKARNAVLERSVGELEAARRSDDRRHAAELEAVQGSAENAMALKNRIAELGK
jgi:DNA repair exonuclease SbcCD ATPase subunit